MAVDPNLPQPPPDERFCDECGRPAVHAKDATLFHFTGSEHSIFEGVPTIPFSRWLYRCRRCRGNDTRWRNRKGVPKLEPKLWEFINTMEDDIAPPYVKSCIPRTKDEKQIARILVKRRLARWVSRWPLEGDALYLTEAGYERMGWDARFVAPED